MNKNFESQDPQLAFDFTPESQRLSDRRHREYARLHGLLQRHLDVVDARVGQEVAREEWQHLRDSLAERIVGHSELLDRLALIALMHRMGWGTQRILLCGPSGAGKTHIATVLAEITRSPCLVQDSQTITEPGWRGASLAEILEGWGLRTAGGVPGLRHAVLVLDEVGKLRVHPEAQGNAIDKRRGVQASLLTLLGVGTPVSVGIDGAHQITSDHMLIVLTEAFSDADWGPRAPSPEELVRYGLMEEFVDRISEVIYVPTQPPELLARVYSEGSTAVLHGEVRIAERLGYRLEVEPATYYYAALRVAKGSVAVGQRSGGHWIAAAARNAIARALRAPSAIGSVIRVTPDDLNVPMPSATQSDDAQIDDRGSDPFSML